MNRSRDGQFIERLWYGDSVLAAWLVPLAWLYGQVVRWRRWSYERGLRFSAHPGVPVIVVGNITAGGTGKTPVVAWLIGQLRAAGRAPGIVSRGYGTGRKRTPVPVSSVTQAAAVGDEPVLLARRTGAPVMVCADRLAAARALVAAGADVIVADDGLQHYALARDLEIAVVDGERRFGNGRLLPAGPLREPRQRLDEVPLVLVNGGQAAAPWHGFRLRAGSAINLVDGSRRPLEEFSGRQAWAVAGIGNPGRFHASLRMLGITVQPVAVPDHGTTDLARLRAQAKWPILMTEKDAVKYPSCTDSNAWYVPVELEMSPEAVAAVMHEVGAALDKGP